MVDYIESFGEQYIDTEFVPNQDTKIELEFSITDNKTAFLYGSRGASSTDRTYSCPVVKNYSTSSNEADIRFDYNNEIGTGHYTKCYVGTQYTIVQDKNEYYINGSKIGEYNYAQFESPYTMKLFALDENGTIENKIKAKMYYAKIWDNGILIRDFVPVYNSIKECYGFYDKVNQKFYESDGAGQFQGP